MSTTKGLGKGLGALIAMFDEESETLLQRQPSDAMKEANEKAEKFFSLEMEKKTIQNVPRGTIEERPSPAITIPASAVQEIELSLIDNNINQPRKNFDPVKLQELADSIAVNGVFQPIIVSRVGSRYLIVAGERRWRAARLAGLATVPAVVRAYSARQIAEISIVENLQRDDLNEIELAQGIKKLMDEFFLTQEKVATVLGKSRSSIANTLRLLSLPKEVQLMVESGRLSAGHAKCLVAVTDIKECIRFANQCVTGGLSVRELEELIRDGRTLEKPIIKPKPQSIELKNMSLELTQLFGTKVAVQGDERQGRIFIEYYDKKDLERIYTKLKTVK